MRSELTDEQHLMLELIADEPLPAMPEIARTRMSSQRPGSLKAIDEGDLALNLKLEALDAALSIGDLISN